MFAVATIERRRCRRCRHRHCRRCTLYIHINEGLNSLTQEIYPEQTKPNFRGAKMLLNDSIVANEMA